MGDFDYLRQDLAFSRAEARSLDLPDDWVKCAICEVKVFEDEAELVDGPDGKRWLCVYCGDGA